MENSMEIKNIIKAVSAAVNGEFDDITVYNEKVEQGLRLPCFFVYCKYLSRNRYRGQRFIAKNEICIQYIPSDSQRENEIIDDTVQRLYECTRYITVYCGGGEMLLDGTNAHYEKKDGYINFYVNYDIFYRIVDETALMEDLTVINKEESA